MKRMKEHSTWWPWLFVILLIFTTSCAGMRKSAIELSLSDIKNAEAAQEVAKNLLIAWPTYSGIIKGALGERISELPFGAVQAMNELDELSAMEIHSEYELGYSLGLKTRMLTDLVIESLKLYAPDILRLLPSFI